jgi:hypothetical protein
MRKNSLLLVLLLGMVSAVAKADTFNLVTAGTLPGGTVYGTVTLTQNGSNVDVKLQLASGDLLISTGAGGGNTVLFDVNLSPITVTGITSGYTLDSTTSANNTIHADGSGNWDYGITCGGCGPGGSSPLGSTLNFTVDNVLISNFVTNPSGFLFAADVCVTQNQMGCPGGTGVVVNSVPTTPTPEPSSLALLGTPALSFGFMQIRRKLLPLWKR